MRFSALSALAVTVPLVLCGAEDPRCLAGEEGAPPRRDVVDAPRESPQSRRPAPAPARPAPPAASTAPPGGQASAAPGADPEKLRLIPRAERPPAAPFPRDLEWVRTSGTPPEDAMRGRVVLIEVWESSCINCLRNLPI